MKNLFLFIGWALILGSGYLLYNFLHTNMALTSLQIIFTYPGQLFGLLVGIGGGFAMLIIGAET